MTPEQMTALDEACGDGPYSPGYNLTGYAIRIGGVALGGREYECEEDARVECNRLNAEWRKAKMLALMAEREKPLVEALRPLGAALKLAEEYDEGAALGRSKIYEYMALSALESGDPRNAAQVIAQWEADNG